MPSVRFEKYHGLGNDFLIVDLREHDEESQELLTQTLQRHASTICDRRRGIGGDGILLVSHGQHRESVGKMVVIEIVVGRGGADRDRPCPPAFGVKSRPLFRRPWRISVGKN